MNKMPTFSMTPVKIDPTNNPYFAPSDGRCPINDLPAELLSQIFILGSQFDPDTEAEDPDDDHDSCCSGHHDDSDDGMSEDGSDASYGSTFQRHLPFELLVTRVCKRWRDVAIEIPSLWSNIVFEDPWNVDMAEAYVRRAKGAPLDISIDCTVPEEEMEDDESWWDDDAVVEKAQFKALVQILELLKPHLEQWKTFELMVSHFILMQHALEIFKDCPGAPNLEHLALYHYEDSEELDVFEPSHLKEQDFVIFNNDIPKLKEIALWGVHLNWERTTFLSGLTDLELAYQALDVRPSYRDFLRMLKSSPALRSLTLCEAGPAGMPVDWLESVQADTRSPAPTEPAANDSDSLLTVTMASVEHLVLAFLPPDYVLALLERVRLPNVTELALDLEQDEYTPVLDRLASPSPAGSNSTKPLLAGVEALKLSGLPCSHGPTLLKAAGALANLKTLSVNFNHVDYMWLELLTAPETVAATTVDAAGEPSVGIAPGTVFFPRLEALSITALDGEGVRDLVARRKEVGKPLKEVYLNQEEILQEEDRAWLKENLDTFEQFEGSDDEDVEELDDLDLSEVDEADIVEDDQDEEWTDEDGGEEYEDDDDEGEFDYVVELR